MSELEYSMMFGETNKDFFQKSIKDRSYVVIGGAVISEFYTPSSHKATTFSKKLALPLTIFLQLKQKRRLCMNNVKIENRTQFFASFHENVPFQFDEGAEDQPQWMAMHAHEYHDARI